MSTKRLLTFASIVAALCIGACAACIQNGWINRIPVSSEDTVEIRLVPVLASTEKH